MQCAEAEVLLVTLLLYDRVQHGFRLNDWATAVLAESGAFVASEPWSATGSQLETALKELESWLPGLRPSRVAVVGKAATLYDGAGGAAAVCTLGQMKNYLSSLLAARTKPAVWLGVSRARDRNHGATLRREYIMPLVAQLLRGEGVRIRRAYEAACVALSSTLPAKPLASATKVCSGRPPRHRARAAWTTNARRDATRARATHRTSHSDACDVTSHAGDVQ